MANLELIDNVNGISAFRLKVPGGWQLIVADARGIYNIQTITDPTYAWILNTPAPVTTTPVVTAPVTTTPVVEPVPVVVSPTPTPTTSTGTLVVFGPNGYENNWTDYSFGVVGGGGSTQPTLNGVKSLQVNLTAWGALNLYHADLDQAKMGTLSFYLTLSAAVPNVYLSGSGQAIFKLPAVPKPGVRTKIDVKVSDFVTGLFTNIALQPDAATVLTVDSMSYTTQAAPIVTAPPVVSPTTPVPAAPAATARWVTGYYVGYELSLQPPEAIDFTTMTHIVMGRVVPISNGALSTTFDYDAVQGPVLAKKVSTLARAAGKKSILMVGGSGTETPFVSACSDTYRATFVANLVKAMTDYGYDGLDLDWEPIQKIHEPLLVKLVHDLRRAAPNAIITIPVDWGSASTVFRDLAPYLDQINIMSYGMADNWPGWTVWHSSALDGEGSTSPSSIQKTVDAYLAAGVPAAKLGVGIGVYGSGWKGPTAPGQTPTAGVIAGDGELSFTNLTRNYINATNVKRDATASVPYISSATGLGGKGLTFISYEDEASILAKAAWCRAKGLGGTILWTIGQQYNATATVKNPILAAAKKGFLD